MSNPKVLIACEESQRVCTAFRERGNEAYSCDIQECSGGHPEWHIMGDCLPLLNGRCEFYTMDGTRHYIGRRWDLIIAHPPCTYLSNAGAARLFPRKGQLNQERYQKGLEAKAFFMKFYNADADRIAIENPIPTRIYELPPYSQTVQPYEHGHPYSKKNVFVAQKPPCVISHRYSDRRCDFLGKRWKQRLSREPKKAKWYKDKRRKDTFKNI